MRNILKRAGAIFLVLMMLTPAMGAAYAGDGGIRFGEDGKLKILIISDTQDTENPQEAMLKLLNASLDSAEPDLVVFLGYDPRPCRQRDGQRPEGDRRDRHPCR